MGCAQSRIDNEEAVSRCKDRRNLMKEAVSARNAFAAGHTAYAMALKNAGAALSDYGHGESEQSYQTDTIRGELAADPRTPPPPLPPHIDSLPPPPPPLPNFSPSPIKRANSMPEIHAQRRAGLHRDGPVSGTIDEGEEEEEGEGEEKGNGGEDKVQNLRRPHRGNRDGRDLTGAGQTGVEVVGPLPSAVERSQVPPMPESKGLAWDYFFMVENMPGPTLGGPEEEEEEVEDVMRDVNLHSEVENERFHKMDNLGNGIGVKGPEEEPKILEKVMEERVKMAHIEHSNTAPSDLRRVGKVAAIPQITLMNVLGGIDDHFLKAYESAQEVSKMLEATRLHYHSNFADNRGHIDHSARVMRVITWNKSFRGISNGDGGKDDFDADEYETHATVLDKLLAWEKKLYDEVKQGELMKLEYQRKVSVLNKQKKRGVSTESLEKTKAAVSHLHTRYIVDMQSMDSTALEINHIRDEQLYPMLVSLVDGMARMWERMCFHHDTQQKIVNSLESLDISNAPPETTLHHKERTVQLHKVALNWHSQFEKFTAHQKQYVRALNGWLKLNLIPIESSLKEKISSPPRAQNPPIQALVHTWHDLLEKLPDEVTKSAIHSFAEVVKMIIDHQDEEIKLKERCEEARKEFIKKNHAFDDWYQKYMHRKGSDVGEEGSGNTNDPVVERQAVVESLKKRWEEEAEAHQRHCIQVREKSLSNLKIRLPGLFKAMTDYAHSCSDAYQRLRSITQTHK
ncbi:hypothetical protein SAY86_001723 [Trapa natans]|uniref:Nitrate regulatory gene2 protein-like n=1 Tax=Trapa natans TaxID=22666 RepID=A0AAN7LHZ5_TRANT|nr:hypothetical protein SAY86_001723 [Trapa natans]